MTSTSLLCSVKSCRVKSEPGLTPAVRSPSCGYANPHLLDDARRPGAARSKRRRHGRSSSTCVRPRHFAAGHIPGAVHLDLWGVSLIDTDPAPLKAFMWMIDHLFNLRGVDAKTPVVVYDEQSGMRAARAFWFLEYFGHPDVQVLDGGFGAWVARGTAGDARCRAAAAERRGPARRRSGRSRPGATSRRASAARTSVILDTRSDGEHNGTLVRAKRGGADSRRRPRRMDAQPRPRRRVQARRRADARCTNAPA